jgi:hypothetical protein
MIALNHGVRVDIVDKNGCTHIHPTYTYFPRVPETWR